MVTPCIKLSTVVHPIRWQFIDSCQHCRAIRVRSASEGSRYYPFELERIGLCCTKFGAPGGGTVLSAILDVARDLVVSPGPGEGNATMADSDKEGAPMWHGAGTRRMVRVGACLAFVSSILVVAGPASVAAPGGSPAYQPGDGQFSVQLNGKEVPGGGDPDGRGSAQLKFDAQQNTACFTISWSGLDGEVTALHLHEAVPGSEGPHHIDFFNNQHFPGSLTDGSGCVPTTPEKIQAAKVNPAAYYLNLHSTAHEKGAIRGQLR
jgi:hypothetical protein